MSILIALGGGPGVWDEFKAAALMCNRAGVSYDVGAANNAGCHYRGDLALWCSLHPERLQRWQLERERNGLKPARCVVSRTDHVATRVDKAVAEIWSGSSGLYVCQVALITLDYEKVVVCGVPMSEEPNTFTGAPWDHAPRYFRGWRDAHGQPEMAGRIKSMSGRTRDLVGAPDIAWLKSAVPSTP